jgi:hypothetical protein
MEFPDGPPRLLPEDYLFCELGTLLAFNFLRTSTAAVEQLNDADSSRLRSSVIAAYDELLEHRALCDQYHEDGSGPAPPPTSGLH